MTDKTEDSFLCPACEAVVPASHVCAHLREHEGELALSTMTEDTLGADASRRKLLRTVQAHSNLRWLGHCICVS